MIRDLLCNDAFDQIWRGIKQRRKQAIEDYCGLLVSNLITHVLSQLEYAHELPLRIASLSKEARDDFYKQLTQFEREEKKKFPLPVWSNLLEPAEKVSMLAPATIEVEVEQTQVREMAPPPPPPMPSMGTKKASTTSGNVGKSAGKAATNPKADMASKLYDELKSLLQAHRNKNTDSVPFL